MQVQEALARANAVAQEVLSAMRTVFSFANEAHELERYSSCVRKHYALNVRQTAISGVYYMVCACVTVCSRQSRRVLHISLIHFTCALPARVELLAAGGCFACQ